jgi:hypothetical protein
MDTELELPRYRLIKPLFADDTYFDEESIIDYDGVPNEFMQPLNDAARAQMRAFIDSLTEIDDDTGFTPGLEAQIDKSSDRATAHRMHLANRGGRRRREITPIIPDTANKYANGEMPEFHDDIPVMPGTNVDGKPILKRNAGPKKAKLLTPEERAKYKKPGKVFGTVRTENPTPSSI